MNDSNQNPDNSHQILPADQNRQLQNPAKISPLEVAGQMANRAAGKRIFQRYLSEKSVNTIKRQARDLELFAEYLIDVRIPLDNGADFQTNPAPWRGVTWGIVEGFIQWLLGEGYAINTVNARLSTVKVYAQMAVKAGIIAREEGMLIHAVSGFSRASGHNVDAQRMEQEMPTRMDEITYAYKPEGRRRSVVVTRHSTKKRQALVLDEKTAVLLKTPANASPQGCRDALLLCLLLDHGLRASEVALLQARQIDLAAGTMTFYRPKIKGSDHEWTTHQLTAVTHQVAMKYLNEFYPPALLPEKPLILATTRLRKDGSGGQLLDKGLNRVRISERVAWLGEKAGLSEKISAHDCRHTCATRMARLDYGVDELMAWFGWTSAQTAVRYIANVTVQQRHRG